MSERLYLLALLLAAPTLATAASTDVPQYSYEIVHTYPHDPTAFTEGLFYLNGFLYESTGYEGKSTIRKERISTGKVVQYVNVAPDYFGEGIVNWKDHLIGLTYTTHIGFVYDLATLKLQHSFMYSGEGWGLTRDAQHIIMSDGTAQLRFLDPDTLRETARLNVTYDGKPLTLLNELEWVKGEIYANVWKTNWIARIDPVSGKVTGLINLSGILPAADRTAQTDVLNGIAYDAQHDRLFVTGKYWPKLFEIKVRADMRAALTH